MPKNIVICCDGTGNEINTTISNVLKLYRVLEKDEGQRVYYRPGVGTIGLQSTWRRFKQETYGVLGLATGAGLDEDTLAVYRFLCETWQDGDGVWLFGFSRGAYTVRVLAAFIQVIGLLPPDQIDLAGYAFSAYKNASSNSQSSDGKAKTFLDEAWHFSRVAGGYHVPIEFMGVWDTVASIIVPRQDKFLPDLQTLVYTRTNPSVKKFRQAISIDERRRMFRLNRWIEPQKYRPDTSIDPARSIRISGRSGSPACTPTSAAAIRKIRERPFEISTDVDDRAGHCRRASCRSFHGQPSRLGSAATGQHHIYVKPDSTAPTARFPNAAWEILEWLPKQEKWREWPGRKCLLGWYLPRGEPRSIPEGAIIHRSVIERMAEVSSYRPINMPVSYTIEEGPTPPVAA